MGPSAQPLPVPLAKVQGTANGAAHGHVPEKLIVSAQVAVPAIFFAAE